MSKAVVVGAGPNGLAAGIHLARHGIDVQVLEARDSVGGGARSGELTVPGVIHDHCSAFHPLGVGSPFWREIDLQSYGLMWKWPEIDRAHPLDDGTAGVLYESIDQTVARMGRDGTRWRRAVGDLAAGFDQLAQDLLRPVINIPRHPIRLAAFGPRAVLPATVMARWFRTEQARALFGGAAAHVYTRLDRPLTASLGLMNLASGHRYGWPVAEGGTGSITDALAAALKAHGGSVTTGVTVARRGDIPDADVVMLDLSPAGLRSSMTTSASRATSPGQTPTVPVRGRSISAAASPRSRTPNANAHKARCRSGHSCSSGSSTWPTGTDPRATSTRYGPTRTYRSATPATPPTRSLTR